jgi:hypothetical protein
MKKVFYFTTCTLCIIAGVALTSFANPTSAESEAIETLSPFDEGWETGYCEGWKDVKGQNVWCPTTPWAPTPDWDCGDSYRCGYNRGFKFARCKAQGFSNCKK